MKTRNNNFKLSTTFWLFAASHALYVGFAAADWRQDADVNKLARSLATRHFMNAAANMPTACV